MVDSSLVKLLQTFNALEKREARKFLCSPFFNQRQDLIVLFDFLTQEKQPDRQAVWAHLFGQIPLDLPKLRLLMTYLHQLLEQYLAVRELQQEPLEMQLRLSVAYRKRGLGEAFERSCKRLENQLDAQTLRNADFFDYQYRLRWEAHQYHYPQKPTDSSHLHQAGLSADTAYLTRQLRLLCLHRAHQAVYQSDSDFPREAALTTYAQSAEFAGLPAVQLYLYCYHMLREPENEQHFQGFKFLLLHQSACFSAEEMHALYLLAINYCVRRLNSGDETYYSEALDLYKEGLTREYLFENEHISRFTYHNIVAAGLHTGELEWVRYFINEYRIRLERSYRDSSFSFNLARLEYAYANYGHVLELLQKANYRDPLLNLAAKTLLLKTYYDLREFDLLQSHLDAMRNYIHRKRVLGYHRSATLNLIRFTEKLIRLNPSDKKAAAALRLAIENEQTLREKSFLLGVMS